MKKLLLLCVGLFFASTAFADTINTFSFTIPLGDIGTSDTFKAGILSVVLNGYAAPSVSTDMYIKAESATETGLGLASGLDREISGTEFVQLNLGSIFAASPKAFSLSLNSIQGGDSYDVWGSNIAGQLGTLIAANQSGLNFALVDPGTFQFIAITSPMGTVLLDNLAVTTGVTTGTPEPATLLLLSLGLLLLGCCSKKASSAIVPAIR